MLSMKMVRGEPGRRRSQLCFTRNSKGSIISREDHQRLTSSYVHLFLSGAAYLLVEIKGGFI
jgi:hypothetical protein